MTMSPTTLFKNLADETRLRIVTLLHAEGELCVCEIAAALALSQPKISRHLALLRSTALLQDSRRGQWIYYQIHPQLDGWVAAVLQTTSGANTAQLQRDRQRLGAMGERPDRQASCC